MSQPGTITGMNLSISAWPNVLKCFLRNLVSLEAPAPKTGKSFLGVTHMVGIVLVKSMRLVC